MKKAARRNAPGQGRKPRGEFSGLTSNFSTRCTPEMRAQLESGARETGQSLSQYISGRLQRVLDDDEKAKRDPKTAALLNLINELAISILQGRDGEVSPTVYSNPFLFRAFSLGVQQLLEYVAPPGEIEPFPLSGPNDPPPPKWLIDVFASPEARASNIVAYILDAINNAEMPSLEKQMEIDRNPHNWGHWGRIISRTQSRLVGAKRHNLIQRK